MRTMCGKTAVERRNRALIAFTLLTGARVAALASARVRYIDLVEEVFYQDAREVRTKFSKTFESHGIQRHEDKENNHSCPGDEGEEYIKNRAPGMAFGGVE